MDSAQAQLDEELKSIKPTWDTIPNDGPYLHPKGYYLEEDETLGRINRFIEDHDTVDVITGLDYLELENSRWNRLMYIELQKGRTLEWNKFLNYFVGKLPIIIFLFLPLFALSFWAVYIWRDYFYIEHLIFPVHVQTVFFIMLILEWLINFSWPELDLNGPIMLLFIV